jgi:mannitol-1-phosphate 5-dehydrogenase
MTTIDKRVVIFGAGSTGRGHLGELAFAAGWEPVFVDRNAGLVRVLREAGRYTVKLCTGAGHRVVTVEGLRAYHTSEVEAIVAEALEVPLMLTAVFSDNLPDVAPMVARIVEARRAARVDAPLNVVCCENMQNSSTMLRTLVEPLAAVEGVGFPDCMVSRVVPLAENPLEMVAEDYNEWTVDAAAWEGPAVKLPAMELVDNQEARLARKFFMHNGAHAVCAYWGFHRGHTYIHEAVADDFVLERVVGAIEELAPIVARRYGLDAESVREYGMELGARGAVAELKDLILRVVRDPLRKLSRAERFVAPAEMAIEYGLPCEEIVWAIGAVLHYHHPDDAQSVEMRKRLETEGVEAAAAGIMGLAADHPLVAKVVQAYRAFTVLS